MDYQAFIRALQEFVSIPPAILAYARYAASRQDDQGRRALLGALQQLHGEVAPLEQGRRTALRNALAVLCSFEDTHMHAIRKAAEEGEQKAGLATFQKSIS
ncbi:MAG: hypothetical protein PHZ00_00885 [Candidatus Peribacteraceae bacterium]|nr:hypothetical protein [Candidatus Peribacteraceae bacterium]